MNTQEQNPVAKELPGDFTIKIVVKQPQQDLTSKLMTVISDSLPDDRSIAITQKPSRQNNYVSFSACFWADSKDQLDTIYQVLHAMPEVMMTL